MPEGIDPQLWFKCGHDAETREYLYNARWHTFPGRMAAYCVARQLAFRVSLDELPEDLPTATRYWVQGFLAGNMPRQPDLDDDEPSLRRWEQQRDQYFASGSGPQEGVSD